MMPYIIIGCIAAYFLMLIVISLITSRGADNSSFFIGNRNSPWYLVAFGMIGTSLSGVTFISIPGAVGDKGFSYMQMVLGYLVGYTVIATVLIPLYYRLNLVSIYGYLKERFGVAAYKTGAAFFLMSRTIGAALRIYLVADVLQFTVFNNWDVPFYATVLITILLIWLYTFRGGIKTIVWTDSLQTLFMLLAVGTSIFLISDSMNWSMMEMIGAINESDYSKTFFWADWNDGKHFFKMFTGGIFIAIAMTGLDQDMMQKNLSCRNVRDAQKNVFTFSIILVFVNLFFLALGALLYLYSDAMNLALPADSDRLYPFLATEHLGTAVSITFILGLVAAAYSSADSALTALTTSVCVDFLDIEKRETTSQPVIRTIVHVCMSLLLAIVVLIFNWIKNDSLIWQLFIAAGYTYGPLLGMFFFGILTKIKVHDRFVPVVCILSPVICYILDMNSESWFGGYRFSFELLLLNGILTFLGLALIRRNIN